MFISDLFRVILHLLPRSKAFRMTIDKTLRRFFLGLAGFFERGKSKSESAWLDLFPSTTNRLTDWERQFNLRDSGLTESQRRSRLDAAWKRQEVNRRDICKTYCRITDLIYMFTNGGILQQLPRSV